MTASTAARIDLVVPARNEETNIAALMRALPGGHPGGFFRHVVVADNGSTDKTAELAAGQGAVVVHEAQPGYGAACLAGLAWIRERNPDDLPDAVAFLDADLADDPAQLPALCEPILAGRAEMVIGTRVRLAERGSLDPHQRFGNWLACVLIGWTAGRRFRDLGPMRVVAWPSLEALGMRDRTWGWTVEMQFKAVRMGMRVAEIDVPYRKRRSGRSKISGSLVGSARAGGRIAATIYSLWRADRRARKKKGRTGAPLV